MIAAELRNYLDIILLEDRMDFLQKKFIPIIAKKIGQINIPQDIKTELEQLSGTPEERLFAWFANKDPSATKEYVQWIIQSAINRNTPLEDFIYVRDSLKQYIERKKNNTLPPEARDIGRIKTPSELDVLLRGQKNIEQEHSDAELAAAMKSTELLLNDSQVLALIPKTQESAMYWGRGTEWCTAWGDPKGLHPKRENRWDDYSDEPILTIIIKANPTEKYQMYVGKSGKQYMDKNDRKFNPDDLLKRYPQLAKPMLDWHPSAIAYIKNPSEKEQLVAVNRDGRILYYLINRGIIPSEKVQLAAVSNRHGIAIKDIIDAGIKPIEAIQLAAVTQDGASISFIIDAGITPSEEVQIAAVNQFCTNCWNAIKYIINGGITPGERVQLAAVKQNAKAITYIVNAKIKSSEAVQLAAVSQDGHVIRYIIDAGIKPSETVQIAAVSQDGNAIQYLDERPSEDVQLAAVNQNGEIIKYIIDAKIKPSDAVQLAAVNQNGSTIKYIIDAKIKPSEALQLAAVNQNGEIIKYIIDAKIKPSEAVQLASVKQNGITIKYIISEKTKIKPSEAVQLAAVKQNSEAIEYIFNAKIKPSEDVQIAAVQKNGIAIKYIIYRGINPSEAVQLAAVAQNGNAIWQIIKGRITPSETVQLAAVKQNPFSIKTIINGGITPSEMIQLAAVEQESSLIKYIKNPSEAVRRAAQLSESGVGRITPQNQTGDVGPNQIKKEAEKFGFNVDKDGRPPLLHKSAAKNSTPNKLMNLGLAETSQEKRAGRLKRK